MSLTLEKGIPIAAAYDGDEFLNIVYVDYDVPLSSGNGAVNVRAGVNLESIPMIYDVKFSNSNEKRLRETLLIVGRSGSGKSWFTAKRAKIYNRIFPSNNIWLFSMVDEDPAYEQMEKDGVIKRVTLDENFFKEDIFVLDQLSNCLCIFDDIDNHPVTSHQKKIYNIMNQILTLGRKSNISLYMCSHHMNNTGVGMVFTRTMFLETDAIVIFNRDCHKHQCETILPKYFDIPKKKVQKLFSDHTTRWTMITKNRPRFIMTDYYIRMLN